MARELNGCVNDAKNVRKFLMSMFDTFPHISPFRPHDPLHRELEIQTRGYFGLDRRHQGSEKASNKGQHFECYEVASQRRQGARLAVLPL